METPIYLDYNASTPVPRRVRDVMLRALEEGFGNPSASHWFGRRARSLVDHARQQVAALLGAHPQQILFTSGGTEANNLAICGLLAAKPQSSGLVTSQIDHPATLAPARVLEQSGVHVIRVLPEANGAVHPERVTEALGSAKRPVTLVSMLLAQNETGVLQPMAEIARDAHARGALVHTDAAQAVGKIRIDVNDLDVDLLSVAGHKLYAPKGVGALYVRRDGALQPVLVGAGHERGFRPGTENVSGIVALGEACAMAMESLDEESVRQRRLRDRLEAKLVQRGFIVHGSTAERLPNTINGRFPGIKGSELVDKLSDKMAFSTQSACHSGEEKASSILLAMGILAEDALGAIRLSLGRMTTEEEIEQATEGLLGATA